MQNNTTKSYYRVARCGKIKLKNFSDLHPCKHREGEALPPYGVTSTSFRTDKARPFEIRDASHSFMTESRNMP